jgi:hypothetical protein
MMCGTLDERGDLGASQMQKGFDVHVVGGENQIIELLPVLHRPTCETAG